jgi:hypothetical protein
MVIDEVLRLAKLHLKRKWGLREALRKVNQVAVDLPVAHASNPDSETVRQLLAGKIH